MAVLSGNRIAWQYTSDDGNTYRVAAQKAMTDQSKLGGEAWEGAVGPLPKGYKMRRITVGRTGGSSRVLPVYSLDAGILVAGATVNANVAGDSAAFVSDGSPIAEQRPRHSVTRQSS
jgi:hypothetical protein